MKPIYVEGNVRASCPDCGGTITTFEFKDYRNEYGTVVLNKDHNYKGNYYGRILYKLLRCASCGRGGMAVIHDNGQVINGELEIFYPISIDKAKIPPGVPDDILSEYREAEQCASFGSWRAASALLRSTLEKTLKANGYKNGNLKDKIDEAANDGIITESRKKKVHEDIRVLGNDVLHDEWRLVTEDEVILSHHYTQRILEDFYDDRSTVENMLKSKGRIT
jgi:hypothetical protein